jgi:hypothetical protein
MAPSFGDIVPAGIGVADDVACVVAATVGGGVVAVPRATCIVVVVDEVVRPP